MKLSLKLSNSTSVAELRPDCIRYLKKNKDINFINNIFEDKKLYDTIPSCRYNNNYMAFFHK